MNGEALRRILRFDPSAFDLVPDDPAVCWRSFRAIYLGLPSYWLIIEYYRALRPDRFDTSTFLLAETLTYVISWVLFPQALLILTRLWGEDRHVLRLITAWNWFTLAFILAVTPLVLLGLAALPEAAPWSGMLTIVGLASLGYNWFILRHGLKVEHHKVAIYLVISMMIDLLLSGWSESIGRAAGAGTGS